MSDFMFETNPPLNLFTYAIPVLFSKLTGFPLHYGLFIYNCLMVAASAFATRSILRLWPFLSPQDVRIAVAGLVLSSTLLTGSQFGERDGFIALALFPFVLFQVAITFGLPYPKNLKWPVFLIGAVLILLKPHHGLIPTILLAHRMIRQRRWKIFFDPDFIALAAMTSLYILGTWFFFHDYIVNIVPDIMRLYLPLRSTKTTFVFSGVFLYVALMLLLFTHLVPLSAEKKRLYSFFSLCSILSLIPFLVQGMSFGYHLFPCFVFMTCTGALLVQGAIEKRARPSLGPIGVIAALGLLFYTIVPLNPSFPTHRDYANFPLTEMLRSCRQQQGKCNFLMFHENMGIVHESAYYSGAKMGSRFASLWFLPVIFKQELELENGRKTFLSKEEIRQKREKYSTFMAEDLKIRKPALAIIGQGIEIDGHPFDFIAYFSANPAFRKEWAHYKKIDAINLAYRTYFTKSAYDNGKVNTYDIYRRMAP